MTFLRRVAPSDILSVWQEKVRWGNDAEAATIVEAVRLGGEPVLRDYAVQFGELVDGQPMIRDRAELEEAFSTIGAEVQALLLRIAQRIEGFASAQRDALSDVEVSVRGGRAGHRWIPVSSVGAYAPGGRHPLPSSVLMTVVPARVAGVESVWVASPRPTAVTLAAAWVAGADGLLAVGGAHAIAALAFGTMSPAVDLIVGPGNRWVTSAKKHLYGEVGIDGLAGPSEIVVLADDTADPALVAADLIAQAEHDVDAVPALVTTSADLERRVEREVSMQLEDLPTSSVALASLGGGFSVVTEISQAVEIVNRMAPEHLALHTAEPETLARQLTTYGSIFLGSGSGETFADYGAGPNHVLPTGRSARFQSGLSVATFLRSPTWLQLDDSRELIEDTSLLARLEGLEAHARAAELRSGSR